MSRVVRIDEARSARMSSNKPALEDGYTRIVNAVVEGLAKFPLSQMESRCVWAIIRKTYGFNKSKDRIAASQLAELMSSPEQTITRQKASTVLAGLIRKRVVLRDGGSQSAIKLNTRADEWQRPVKATKAPQNPKANRNHESDEENGSLNRNTVRNVNPNTDHTKDKRQGNNSATQSMSGNAPGHSPEETGSGSMAKAPAALKPNAVVQSPNGKKWGEQVDVDLARLMAETIDARTGGDAPANRNMVSWANDIRLMRERDNRPPEAIRALFAWSQQHHFWHCNILSPDKLRKQWTRLAMERNDERKRGKGNEAGRRAGRSGSDGELTRQQTDLQYAIDNF